MRHRVQGTALGRDTKHRKALVRNLLTSLFQYGEVETTDAKAKTIKRLADKVITKGKPGTVSARRNLEVFFGKRQIANHIIESVLPALKDRNSGFTRTTRLGKRRGDDASMVKLELVSAPLAKPDTSTKPKAKADKKVAAEATKTSEKSDAPAPKKAAKPAAKKSAPVKAEKKAAAKPKSVKKVTKSKEK